jgi:hypothetical protein
VIKSIPSGVTAVGNPARIIGQSSERTSAAAEMDLALKSVVAPCGAAFRNTWAIWADGSIVYEDIDIDEKGYIDRNDIKRMLTLKHRLEIPDRCVDLLFSKIDVESKGKISKNRFESILSMLDDKITTTRKSSESIVTAESAVDDILTTYINRMNETVSDGSAI